MQKLVLKYENRMREFVLKMAEKPVIVKKTKDKFSTTRQEFFALTSNKILDKKGFQFKSYNTCLFFNISYTLSKSVLAVNRIDG